MHEGYDCRPADGSGAPAAKLISFLNKEPLGQLPADFNKISHPRGTMQYHAMRAKKSSAAGL
jgi:hypothetical protein